MKKIEYFKDFDFNSFWEKSEYSLEAYTEEKPSDELIESIEKELGYKLPQSYIEMMKIHNGGTPYMSCFPTETATSWAGDHVAISGFSAIGREKQYSLCGEIGSQFMIDIWEYPNYGVIICDCPSGGHDVIMLDYRQCGKDGEPSVIHITDDHDVTFLAENFETFVRGLVNEEVYDTSEEDLKEELANIKTGRFSTTLEEFFPKSEIDFDTILRNLFTAITNEKGFFAFHADNLSLLAYDIQFHLFYKNNKIDSKENYLSNYEKMVAFSNGDISTHGYAPSFVEDWFESRLKNLEIVNSKDGLVFSKEYEAFLLKEKLNEYK